MTRGYASFFEWPDRQRKELGIVEELIATLGRQGASPFHSPQVFQPDPPDCTAVTSIGESIAIEVTELVSEEAARRNAQGHAVSRQWQAGDLATQVRAQLLKKDSKSLNGGPYARFAVVLFTDEPLLLFEYSERALSEQFFGPFVQIGEAYLLFSYCPRRQLYPALRLRLAG